LAEYLGLTETTIRQWRWMGKGPRWVKVGRHVRYPQADTDAWLDAGADSPKQARSRSA
jgi:excisionase family DNA binding protein